MAMCLEQRQEVVAEMADLVACAHILRQYGLGWKHNIPESAFIPDPFYITGSEAFLMSF
jgi:hypothetical protein